METEFNPNYAVHPGLVLKDDMDSLHLKQIDVSVKTGISKTVLNEIIKGKRSINARIAVLLESALGESAEFWLKLQYKYDETLARIKLSQELAKLGTTSPARSAI